jgi:hypothetical protein
MVVTSVGESLRPALADGKLRSMKKLIATLTIFIATSFLPSPFPGYSTAMAAPYAFTADDYLEYGIYFSEGRGAPSSKLLTIRYGDIGGYYAEYLPWVTSVPTRRQELNLKTKRGSIRVDRNDNVGLTVTRDTYNERKRTGTKRLEIRFEKGRCISSSGVRSACSVRLSLRTNGPDRAVIRQRRILRMSTSSGLSFTYRSLRSDGSKPLNPALRRSPAINNYAWEWRPSVAR